MNFIRLSVRFYSKWIHWFDFQEFFDCVTKIYMIIGYIFTVRKWQNFPVTQILREIKGGECRNTKSASWTHADALNFDFYKKMYTFWRLKFTKSTKFRASKMAKKEIVELQDSEKLISRKIWLLKQSYSFHTIYSNR